MSEKKSGDSLAAKKYAFYILSELREHVAKENLKKTRLPEWFYNTAIRVGRLNDTTMFLFSHSDDDEFVEYIEVVSDAQFILDIPDYILPGHKRGIDIRNDPKSTGSISVLPKTPGNPGEVVMLLSDDKPIHLNAGYVPYHVPIMYSDIVFQWEPDDIPLISRHVPFLLYIHDCDLSDPDRLSNVILENIKGEVENVHDSALGDMYETRSHMGEVAQTDVGKSVAVLGGYDSQRRNEQIPRSIKQELLDMRTYLSSQNYEAHLIEDLYASAEMSLETKVRAYTATSRFCMMVDREASGHIKEYEIVKQNRIPLALFRPLSDASTWLIGDDEFVDLNYIKTFEFEDSALERMDDAIDWAESIVEDRAEAYKKHYSWR